MITWVTDVWQLVTEVFQLICTSVQDLITMIDDVSFSTANPIFQYWGNARWVMGEPIYIVLTATITLGALMMIYRLTVIVFDIIKSLIPGMGSKINFH